LFGQEQRFQAGHLVHPAGQSAGRQGLAVELEEQRVNHTGILKPRLPDDNGLGSVLRLWPHAGRHKGFW
jgi:hypothetical protein